MALQRTVFSEPWWLEAVAPSAWTIVSTERSGQTCAEWATTERSIGGRLRVIGAPLLTPYLGPIVDPGGGARPKQISRAYAIVDELREQLPPFDICTFQMRADQGPWFPLAEHGFRAEARQTHVLDDLEPDVVWAGLSGATRNVIRKAERMLSVEEEGTSATLWEMVVHTFERQARSVPYSASLLARIVDMAISFGKGQVLVARDTDGRPHAAILVVWDDQRSYYLVGGADAAVRNSGATSLLLWHAIQHSGRHADAFDFEGSMVPGVARFFAGFGGRPETYLSISAFSPIGQAAWAAGHAGRSMKRTAEAWRRRRTSAG